MLSIWWVVSCSLTPLQLGLRTSYVALFVLLFPPQSHSLIHSFPVISEYQWIDYKKSVSDCNKCNMNCVMYSPQSVKFDWIDWKEIKLAKNFHIVCHLNWKEKFVHGIRMCPVITLVQSNWSIRNVSYHHHINYIWMYQSGVYQKKPIKEDYIISWSSPLKGRGQSLYSFMQKSQLSSH